jgi:hypothetical protein
MKVMPRNIFFIITMTAFFARDVRFPTKAGMYDTLAIWC